VALHLAARRPALVGRLIVCGAAIAPAEQPVTLRVYRMVPDRVARGVSDVAGDGWRALVDEIATIDIRRELARVQAPTLVTHGRWEWVSVPDAREIAARIPGARLWQVPHLGHSWMVHAPRVFADAVRGFARAGG
jgi:pimeloyl-ACP methyl ester carboxylesterase